MTEIMTAEEYLRTLKGENKYGARGETVAGRRFDSQAELRRWGELELLAAAGEIAELRHHPRYVVIDASPLGPAVVWEADSEYLDRRTGRRVAEDVKGGRATITDVFRIKARLFRERYPEIELRIEER